MFEFIRMLSQGIDEVAASYATHMYAVSAVNLKWGGIIGIIAGGLLLLGVIFICLYHKTKRSGYTIDGWLAASVFMFVFSGIGSIATIILLAIADLNKASALGALYKIIVEII